MPRIWAETFVMSVEMKRGDLSQVFDDKRRGRRWLISLKAYFAAAQKAKWVCCSSTVRPVLPTSSRSRSFHAPGPAKPVMGTSWLIILNKLSHEAGGPISFLRDN